MIYRLKTKFVLDGDHFQAFHCLWLTTIVVVTTILSSGKALNLFICRLNFNQSLKSGVTLQKLIVKPTSTNLKLETHNKAFNNNNIVSYLMVKC